MQLRINLSIQMPNDTSSLLPIHSDVWSGDSPFEAVVWLPLVNCYKTKSMFILPPSKYNKMKKIFLQKKSSSSEQIFQKIKKTSSMDQYQIWRGYDIQSMPSSRKHY